MADKLSGIVSQIKRELGNVSSNFFNFRNEAKNNDDSLFNIVKDAGNAIKTNKTLIEDVRYDVQEINRNFSENVNKTKTIETNLNQVINNQKQISSRINQFDSYLNDFRKSVLNRFTNLNQIVDNIALMQRRQAQEQQQPQKLQSFKIPAPSSPDDTLMYRYAGGTRLLDGRTVSGGSSILGKLGLGAASVAGVAGITSILGSGAARASASPIERPPPVTPPPSSLGPAPSTSGTTTGTTPSTSGSSESQYKPVSIPNRGWHSSFNMLKAQKIDPLLVESVKSGAINAFGDPNDPNTRYEVRINNAHRPGSVGSKHAHRKAIDLQIYDRVEKKFVGGHGNNIMMNAFGNPYTYNIYQALARGGYQHLYSKYGEKVAKRFSHGGNFFARQGIIGGAARYGGLPYDQMHYSLDEGGRQGSIVGGAGSKIQAHLRKYEIEPAGPMGDVLEWKSPYRTQQSQPQTEGSQPPPPQSSSEKSDLKGFLKDIRLKQLKEIKDPKTRAAVFARMEIEVGSQGKKSQQAWLESLFNRAASRGISLYSAVDNNSRHRYYPIKDNSKWRRMSQSITETLEKKYAVTSELVGLGSNISNFATGNASGTVGFGQGRARRMPDGSIVAPGQTSTYGRERFGVEAPDKKFIERVKKSEKEAIEKEKQSKPPKPETSVSTTNILPGIVVSTRSIKSTPKSDQSTPKSDQSTPKNKQEKSSKEQTQPESKPESKPEPQNIKGIKVKKASFLPEINIDSIIKYLNELKNTEDKRRKQNVDLNNMDDTPKPTDRPIEPPKPTSFIAANMPGGLDDGSEDDPRTDWRINPFSSPKYGRDESEIRKEIEQAKNDYANEQRELKAAGEARRSAAYPTKAMKFQDGATPYT